jgi:hypothetical protein
VIVAVVISMTIVYINHRDGRLEQKARRLSAGMSRDKVIQIMGEPQEKLTVTNNFFGFPVKFETLIEYRYWTTSLGSRSMREIGGIYLDPREEQVVGVSLSYGWIELAGRDMNFLILWGILALEGFLGWWFVRYLCRRSMAKKDARNVRADRL